MRRQLLAAVLVALLFAPAGEAWSWPAAGAVLQPFLFDPAHPYAAGQHRGLDVGGEPGATVPAPAAGTVTFAGTVPSSIAVCGTPTAAISGRVKTAAATVRNRMGDTPSPSA